LGHSVDTSVEAEADTGL